MAESLFDDDVMAGLIDHSPTPWDEMVMVRYNAWLAEQKLAGEIDEDEDWGEEEELAVLDERKLPSAPENMIIVIDWDRADTILGNLLETYKRGGYPYSLDRTRVPQDERHMPTSLERGSKDHAMFLWTVCYYMRGGMRSVDAVRMLSQVYDSNPELFDTEHAAMLDPAELGEFLHTTQLGYRFRQIGKFWVDNAQRMQERWAGDPRQIFDGVDSYEAAIERVKNDQKGGGFFGFKEKMVSMILYYLMDAKMIDEFVFPLPVDLHVLRVTVATEMITFGNVPKDGDLLTSETLNNMRHLYYQYALANQVDPLILCNAVWLLSNSSCGIQPGNITFEPLGRKYRKGRKTMLVPKPIYVNDINQRRDYARSCGKCPVEGACRWNVPAKIYYIQGVLKKRGERVRFIEPNLDLQDEL
jgi:hypothetical protein